MATGIVKAETRGRSSWKEDVFVRMEQSPLPPAERIQSDPEWTRKMASRDRRLRLRLVEGVQPRVPGS